MKISMIGFAVALVAGSIGLANATPVTISNGDFSQVTFGTGPHGTPADTEASVINRTVGQTEPYWVTVNDWSVSNSSTAQAVWYASANGAHNGPGGPKLADVMPPPSGAGSFVGLNGDTGGRGNPDVQAGIQQSLSGFVPGTHYIVGFDWAASQQSGVTGPTTEQLAVSLFGQTHYTDVFSIPTHGFQGWQHVSFGFTANSGAGILSFLSIGSPSGLPPMALLTNVSLAVPEPPVLALFGLGLLGLGLVTVVARRRAQQHDDVDGDGTIG